MSKTVKLDLAPDFEGSWIELDDPKYMPSRLFDEEVARLNTIAGGQGGVEEADRFLRSRVVSWHIAYDYHGTAVSMSDPATDDLKDLPLGVMKILMDKIVELFQANVPSALRRQ